MSTFWIPSTGTPFWVIRCLGLDLGLAVGRNKNGDSVGNSVGGSVEDSVGGSVWDSVWDSMECSFWVPSTGTPFCVIRCLGFWLWRKLQTLKFQFDTNQNT